IYNPLFMQPNPSGENFTADLNPNSLEALVGSRLEPALADAHIEQPVQFERQGYFCLDRDSKPSVLVFSRTIGLRDTWAKEKATG
ncbi:MAG: glutamine--tRNA ligase, partial [Pseudolabrys sp.]